MQTDEIRQAFLDFFKSKGHTIVASDCLVPEDDPTLLFTGAGMNQFKEKFLDRNITYRRAASCQKCLRTGDLENVGRTSGHHTFFEMLGNFSFGDYFKKEAIELAWEFLTDLLKMPAEKLWASVYEDDDEAYEIWRDIIKLPEKNIKKLGEIENFWPSEAPTKGPNGPCGPCSEIFYDGGRDGVEIWNLVFTQFDRQPDGSLNALPNKNIDTGMGLERLASVIQGVSTNFDIDIFKPIVEAIKKETRDQRPETRNRMNAIADHIRAATFAIADGVMPSNEGRGYVVRKLIRRSVLHGRDIGIREEFLYKLVSVVTSVMSPAYPGLKTKRDDIAQVLKREEENFAIVIETQIPKVEEAFGKISSQKDDAGLARLAFNFYDTYGMPYEMLEEIAQKLRMKIDEKAFDELLERQRSQSRAKTKIRQEIFSETFAKKVEALGLKTEFLGYDKSESQANVLEVLEGGEVILDKTPFYGESGGQVGDWGRIETKSGTMEVEDAKRIGDTIVHIGKMVKGRILKGEKAKAIIDEAQRKKIMANHTATHLLNAALRKVLGDHVHQTGSLVDKDHLRFDFTNMKKMEGRQIARVEEIVNDNIKSATPVKKEIKDIETAKKEGAIALFGERYEAKVRVVSIGDISKELCGGTHADNTKAIGIFKITKESAIASGVRRIEALTGEAASQWLKKQREAQSSKLKAQSEKEAEKRAMEFRLKEEIEKIDSLIARSKVLDGTKIVAEIIEAIDVERLGILSDRIREKVGSSVIVLGTVIDDKVSFILAVTDDAVKKGLKASALAKEMALFMDGSAGGRDDFAQGGGRSPAKLKAAFEKIVEILEERLK